MRPTARQLTEQVIVEGSTSLAPVVDGWVEKLKAAIVQGEDGEPSQAVASLLGAKAGAVHGANKAINALLDKILNAKSVHDTISKEIERLITKGAGNALDFVISLPKRGLQRMLKTGIHLDRLSTAIKASYPHLRNTVKDIEDKVKDGRIGEREARKQMLAALSIERSKHAPLRNTARLFQGSR